MNKKAGSKTKAIVKAKAAQKTKRALMKGGSFLNTRQLLFILQKTPASHIYKRKGKGGGEWEYVTGTYMKKCLNHTFGWMWDFEINWEKISMEARQIVVKGRLTIKNSKGQVMITKEQYGRADIKVKRDTEKCLDLGNDFKAAATDALKKCASELGFASDVYGKEEFKQIQRVDKTFQPPTEKEEKAEAREKVKQLKSLLKGKTDERKLANLRKRTGITPDSFKGMTEKHAEVLIEALDAMSKK